MVAFYPVTWRSRITQLKSRILPSGIRVKMYPGFIPGRYERRWLSVVTVNS